MLQPSAVVLQSALPYNTPYVDKHVLNATGGAHPTVFYAYNFGQQPLAGTVSASSSNGASIAPSSFSVSIPVGGRTRFTATITPPGGRAAIDSVGGTVALTGDFGEGAGVASPALFFEVVPDIETVQPKEEFKVPRATTASAWSRNIAPGGSVNVSAAGSCATFTLAFGAQVADAWAYPQLSFDMLHSPPSDIDGIRFTLTNLSTTPPIATPPEYHAMFFNRTSGTQYAQTLSVAGAGSGAAGQEVTVLLRNAHWDGIGVAPSDPSAPIEARDIGALSVGLNLKQTGHTSVMSVCDLRWVRF